MEKEDKIQKMMRVACAERGYLVEHLSDEQRQMLYQKCSIIMDIDRTANDEKLFSSATVELGLILAATLSK